MDKLLFTGGTGFLGKNVMPLLKEKYEVTTCGITPEDMINANLAKSVPELPEHYDVVLHAAGKAHVVPRTEAEKQLFFDINYQGTVNLCQALEKVGVPRALVFISTVAVYGCDYGDMITEEHALEGETPYAKSKRMAEEYLTEWCKEHGVVLGILRPSLLAGKGAPGNLGAMVNGVRKGFYMNIAGGKVIKSILMAEDIAHLLPLVAEKGGTYNVCDTRQPSFGELSISVAKQLGKGKPLNIPYWMAWCMAKVGDLLGSKAPINSYKLEKMTQSLTFSNEKARKELGWEPMDVLENYRI
ncbi:MAG: NAD-dependent epimerase/dehydratase family protein [Prevotellaceae bacterium]|nr:NAD-dependent epimerase/dehydratase family protein [Prevotellaceae bacterium]